MGDWLQRLHTLIEQQDTRPNSVFEQLDPSAVSAVRCRKHLLAPIGTIGTGISGQISPPLDAEGVPCGGCPKCNRGEFWQWPRKHPQHDPREWNCMTCQPIPAGSGPYMTYCGVPDQEGNTR